MSQLSSVRLSDGTEIYESVESKSLLSTSSLGMSYHSFRKNRQTIDDMKSLRTEETNIIASQLHFAGCVLEPPGKALNRVMRETRDMTRFADMEIPYHKYARLRMDIHRFSQELKSFGKESSESSDLANIGVILESLAHLERKLEELRSLTQFEDLFAKNFNPILKTTANKPLFALMDALEGKESLSESSESHTECWSLYRPERREGLGSIERQYTQMEERVAHLEKAIGHVTDMNNPFPDILHGWHFVDSQFHAFKKQQTFNSVKVVCRAMVRDIKTIVMFMSNLRRAPMEKSRRELANKLKELEKVDMMWNLMERWDPVVFETVFIVNRCLSLQHLHYRSAVLCQRVDTLHRQQKVILESLIEDQSALRSALQSLAQNTKQMTQNLAYINHRINYLEQKTKA